MTAYHTTDYSIHEIDDATWASWVSTDHPKAHRYAPVPQQPSYDATTHTCEWGAGEWVVLPIPAPTRRVWATAADFWGEFTQSEQLVISISEIPAVRALVVSLSVWQAEMWSDDQRVQAGFQALIASGLLTEARANAILNPPGLLPS
jgi:hypothetical protein